MNKVHKFYSDIKNTHELFESMSEKDRLILFNAIEKENSFKRMNRRFSCWAGRYKPNGHFNNFPNIDTIGKRRG